MNVFTRFPAHRSVEEGTENRPCELGVWKRCFATLPTDFGKSLTSQLYSRLERLTLSLEKQAIMTESQRNYSP